jgi:hypothetical protein
MVDISIFRSSMEVDNSLLTLEVDLLQTDIFVQTSDHQIFMNITIALLTLINVKLTYIYIGYSASSNIILLHNWGCILS